MLGVCLLTGLAVLAPPETRSEPMVSTVASVRRQMPPPSLLAATEGMAVLVHEGRGDRVRFEFVDEHRRPVAVFDSSRSKAPRLVCVACPRPVVGDRSGYAEWEGTRWSKRAIDARLSSAFDPLASVYGVMREAATRTSVPLLLGSDGRYIAVRDGGTSMFLEPTRLVPASGGEVGFNGDPVLSIAPMSIAFGPSRSSVTSLQVDVMSSVPNAAVSSPHDEHSLVTVRGGKGPLSLRSGVCKNFSADLRPVVLLSDRPRDGFEGPFVPTASISRIELDGSATAVKSLRGSYDRCVIRDDGSVVLWTGTSAGLAAVDIAVVGSNGSVQTKTVPTVSYTHLTLPTNREV